MYELVQSSLILNRGRERSIMTAKFVSAGSVPKTSPASLPDAKRRKRRPLQSGHVEPGGALQGQSQQLGKPARPRFELARVAKFPLSLPVKLSKCLFPRCRANLLQGHFQSGRVFFTARSISRHCTLPEPSQIELSGASR